MINALIFRRSYSMSTDIAALSVRELDALLAKVKQRKAALKKRKPITAVRKRVAALIEKEGYSLSELFGGGEGRSKVAAPRVPAKKGPKLGKVAPKYPNPAQPPDTRPGPGLQHTA